MVGCGTNSPALLSVAVSNPRENYFITAVTAPDKTGGTGGAYAAIDIEIVIDYLPYVPSWFLPLILVAQ